MGRRKKLPKTKKKIHCLQNHFFHTFFGPMGLGETLANFFSFIFPVSWLSREKTNYQIFLLISILIFCSLCWWFAKKIFVIFFGGTGHEPKIDVSFGFWSFDFGGLDFGVLILGVRILEFWFWGFGSWSFDFGFWSFDFGGLDLGFFGLLISFVSFWKVLWVWSGFLGKVLAGMLVRVWGGNHCRRRHHCWEMLLSLFWFPFLSLLGGLGAPQGVWSGFLGRFMGDMIRRVWEKPLQTIHSMELL